MTARTPLESTEAPSTESDEASSAGGEGSSNDDHARNGATLDRGDLGDGGEGSLSKTLEAILSKSDDNELPLGSNITGPPRAAGNGLGSFAEVKLPGVTPVDHEAAGPSISVDTMFDDPEDEPRMKAMAPPLDDPEEEEVGKVGDLLDEVAQALNVQAAESRDRAIGRVPSPGANAHGVQAAPQTPLGDSSEDFEFEDPDDGPTTLNSGDGKLEAASVDPDEEAVVLGPASRGEGRRETRTTGSHPGANLPGASARGTLPTPAVPMPGSAVAAGSRPTRSTPFAGLPAATLPTFPAPGGSARTRLPTPAPGTALSMSGSGPTGRATLPPGAPLGALDGTGGAIAALGSDGASARRPTGRISAPLGTLAGADGSGRTGSVHEPLGSAMSSAQVILKQAILKKDLKFRAISFGAIVLVVFVGGLLIGYAAMKGSPEVAGSTTPAPAASATTPSVPTKANEPAANVPAVAVEPAKAAPVAPKTDPNTLPANTMAEAAVSGSAQMQFDSQPLRKHRARRLGTKDDIGFGAPPPLPPPAPKRVAASTVAPIASKAPAPTKSASKKKAVWHDPFAD